MTIQKKETNIFCKEDIVMIKVYGTNTCPDCMDAKANLDFYHIPYTYIDVCTSVKELKEFIQLRDSSSIFQKAKDNGSLGIPTIIKEDGSITLDWESIIKENGHEVIHVSSGKACGIDGKGC